MCWIVKPRAEIKAGGAHGQSKKQWKCHPLFEELLRNASIRCPAGGV
jgi:hypothetical protein